LNGMEVIVAVSLGLGLATASGFRVFLPPFLYGLALRFDYTPIDIPMEGVSAWMSSDIGLIVLGAAMVLEVLAYYIPWLDNLMDAIASPAAIISGIVLMSSTLTEMDPIVQWSVSIIAGGSVAGTVQIGTVATRALSTMTTGGIANPIVSTVEGGACIACTILALLLPVLALLFSIAAVVFSIRFIVKQKQKQEDFD